VLEQVAPTRLEELRRKAFERIAAMRADATGGLVLRLEALFALGHAS
jgi:hypothetical protein